MMIRQIKGSKRTYSVGLISEVGETRRQRKPWLHASINGLTVDKNGNVISPQIDTQSSEWRPDIDEIVIDGKPHLIIDTILLIDPETNNKSSIYTIIENYTDKSK